MVIVKDWAGREYSLERLSELCDAADEQEVEFCDVIDSDLATTPSIIRALIGELRAALGHD